MKRRVRVSFRRPLRCQPRRWSAADRRPIRRRDTRPKRVPSSATVAGRSRRTRSPSGLACARAPATVSTSRRCSVVVPGAAHSYDSLSCSFAPVTSQWATASFGHRCRPCPGRPVPLRISLRQISAHSLHGRVLGRNRHPLSIFSAFSRRGARPILCTLHSLSV